MCMPPFINAINDVDNFIISILSYDFCYFLGQLSFWPQTSKLSKIFSSLADFDAPSWKYFGNNFYFFANLIGAVMLAITFISYLRPTICNEVTHLTADHFCVSLYIASLYTLVKE
jgi:hypothetical protein